MGNIIGTAPIVTLADHVEHRSKKRLQKMVRFATRHQPSVHVGDWIYFWRDKNRWLGPAKIIRINDNVVTVNHNSVEKTTSLNRVMPTQAPNAALIEEMIELDSGQVDNASAAIEENNVETDANRTSDSQLPPWIAPPNDIESVQEESTSSATQTQEVSASRPVHEARRSVTRRYRAEHDLPLIDKDGNVEL